MSAVIDRQKAAMVAADKFVDALRDLAATAKRTNPELVDDIETWLVDASAIRHEVGNLK